jgi:hypothetical protein
MVRGGWRATALGGTGLVLALLLIGAVQITPGSPVPLNPGDAVIAPSMIPDGPVTIFISLPSQRAWVYRNGVPIAVTTISSGRPGHRTPTGVFTILQKHADHRSSKYASAPMPFMQRLTWDGVALHGGDLPGYPASHGCIRLPKAFARWLYSVTRIGASVMVSDRLDAPTILPSATPLEEGPAPAAALPQHYTWQPARSPSGPVSLVVSERDRRIVVLRNGIEIGRATITLTAPVRDNAAYLLNSIDRTGAHWLRVPLPGEPDGAERELSDDDRAKAHLPDAFRAALRDLLKPGATLLVVRESLAEAGTGRKVRLLETGGQQP